MGKGLGLLRVLDLEGVYNPNFPDNLGDLFHLRYLGLRWTFLDKLPKSVGELPYLQTLDLKHTRIDKIPTTIWKLKNLQHLNLDEVHLDKDAPLHYRESLPDLLTLWGLSVSHESPIKNGLSKMKHLRELGITFQDRGQGQSTEALVKWISDLKDLQSLRLRSKDDCGKPSNLSLLQFSGLTKLSHMKLLGKLQQLPTFDQFPPRVKVLTLSLTFLSKDPMPTLGQLPELTVLRLLGDSFIEDEMVCPRESFKNLEVLKLWVLKDLKEWKVEDGAMKKLKEVYIRRCSKLQNFPASLLEQETFQDLILNNMPSEFKNNISNEYQWKVSIKDF
ncbi:disease resistance RPP8-like protein 3 [Salvia hispanica]|uniref:disease resistance RPP8-like protein 3 n=1 Tax=Salvia hispanica TaxID=49212 RepID=UPI0020093344|nr:disease resistance RPP8-like protein 3 [Salvia hispanica]